MHSRYSPDGSHHKQQITSVSQQGEESPQIRTETYHHDSVVFSVQTEDTQNRNARRDGITACLLLIEKKIPNVPSADVEHGAKGKDV